MYFCKNCFEEYHKSSDVRLMNKNEKKTERQTKTKKREQK